MQLITCYFLLIPNAEGFFLEFNLLMKEMITSTKDETESLS